MCLSLCDGIWWIGVWVEGSEIVCRRGEEEGRMAEIQACKLRRNNALTVVLSHE